MCERHDSPQDIPVQRHQRDVVLAAGKVFCKKILIFSAREGIGRVNHALRIPARCVMCVIAHHDLHHECEHGQHSDKPPPRTGKDALHARRAGLPHGPDAEHAQADAQQGQHLIAQQITAHLRLHIEIDKPVGKDDNERHRQHQQRVDAEDEPAPSIPFHLYLPLRRSPGRVLFSLLSFVLSLFWPTLSRHAQKMRRPM